MQFDVDDKVGKRLADILEVFDEANERKRPSNHEERMDAYHEISTNLKTQLAAHGMTQHLKGAPISDDQKLVLILDTLSGVQQDMVIELLTEQVEILRGMDQKLEWLARSTEQQPTEPEPVSVPE